MKRIITSGFLLCFTILQTSKACTTFFINKNGQMVFGRNYDWVTGEGLVLTNHRGLAKTSLKMEDGNQISWISRYGSITFNQYGKEFPTGGMNEKGLVVELMWLDGTKYSKQDNRSSIAVLQWIQYQLDNASTVDEVIASDKKLRIAAGSVPLHYLVADAQGNAATIEFLNGEMVVHKQTTLPFPVLTNNTYRESVQFVKSLNSGSGASDPQYRDNSLERFNIACTMVQKYHGENIKTPLIDYSFRILGSVDQGNFTKWSIVYDLINKKIYFKTNLNKEIRLVEMNSFDFSCNSASLALNINKPTSGNISREFTRFSTAINRTCIKKSFQESEERITISNTVKEALGHYPETITCQ